MIPITNLTAQYWAIKNEIDEAVLKVLAGGGYILGEEVKLLEEKFAAYFGRKHAVGVSSGTEALVLSVVAAGIKEGDEVITTPFTFIATIESIIRAGAKPVFADIDGKTYNIDPSKIEEKITKKTKAIMPVHLYGMPCDMESIEKIARKHGLIVIEDCAQSFGAAIDEKKSGSFGDFGCFSFFPAKNLGCYGDGGMVVTDDDGYAEKLALLRCHGFSGDYAYRLHGFNSRLDTVQAAILLVKMKYIDSWIDARIKNAKAYADGLAGVEEVRTPGVIPGVRHSMNYYTLHIKPGKEARDALKKFLAEKGITAVVYYPLSMHLQEICRGLGYSAGDYPVSEKMQDEVLSLPMYPELPDKDIDYVCAAVREYFKGESKKQ